MLSLCETLDSFFMRPQEIIEKKRDGGELSVDEIDEFIDGVCEGTWADYQISALLMAIFLRGFNSDESEAFTRAMLYSGEVLDLSEIEGPKADKHSTGGVGDKTSLIIAPLVAACGVTVPMISGRGLGHTGGTLDKLESIPGYRVALSPLEFRSIMKKCGFAMSGQTAEIAPADKKLYALRDATATVPYVPLIVGSIMSKKLAEGLDALVLDVKTGSGAFMQKAEDSRELALALVETGKKFGVNTQAVISDMSQPLGQYVGNAHEIYECVKILRGESEPNFEPTRELSLELSARMLVLAGGFPDLSAARSCVNELLANGEALERFRKNVELQGGDVSICDDPAKLIKAKLEETPIIASGSGFVTAIDTCSIGNAIAAVGGGRIKAEDTVDHAVGYSSLANVGDAIGGGETLGVLYSRRSGDPAAVQILNAYTIGTERIEPPLLITSVIE
jgi:pyrimidine-nucleoside phosphorylase